MIMFLFGFIVAALVCTYLTYRNEITNIADFWHVLKREYKDSIIVLGIPLGLIILISLFS